ncbi:MAG TPA: PHP domain-containing protein [Nocardioidaceae bacterium]|nr:PHP domain-containing protein [Nocardioidaceae bacterium]
MRIDLHTHSDRSDGTTPPRELVRHAAEVGIDVLALTDHDTVEGWVEAAKSAEEHGVTLVRGIEVSCKLEGSAIHLLAYLPDPTYPPLAEELERIIEGRNARLPQTVERLRGLGVDIVEEDVRRVAGDAAGVGRPHVADALVAKGVVKDRRQAFDAYLGSQGPAYVKRYAAPLEEMVRTVAGAGGVSVIAHPWGRRYSHGALDEARFATLKDAGLAGIEVDHQDHDDAARDGLRSIARNLDLVATGSSDYHGEGKVDHDLGCNTTRPEEFDKLVERARASAAASGRPTPQLLAP